MWGIQKQDTYEDNGIGHYLCSYRDILQKDDEKLSVAKGEGQRASAVV